MEFNSEERSELKEQMNVFSKIYKDFEIKIFEDNSVKQTKEFFEKVYPFLLFVKPKTTITSLREKITNFIENEKLHILHELNQKINMQMNDFVIWSYSKRITKIINEDFLNLRSLLVFLDTLIEKEQEIEIQQDFTESFNEDKPKPNTDKDKNVNKSNYQNKTEM